GVVGPSGPSGGNGWGVKEIMGLVGLFLVVLLGIWLMSGGDDETAGEAAETVVAGEVTEVGDGDEVATVSSDIVIQAPVMGGNNNNGAGGESGGEGTTEEAGPTGGAGPTGVAVVAEVFYRYGVSLVASGQDSMYILNSGEVALPLAALRVNELAGSEWGEEMLAVGSCVAVWKDDEDKAPDFECDDVLGEGLIYKKKEVFWQDPFVVSYAGTEVARCQGEMDSCNGQWLMNEAGEVVAGEMVHELLLVAEKEKHLSVFNVGSVAVEPGMLTLRHDSGVIMGGEWTETTLASRECVAFMNDDDDKRVEDACKQLPLTALNGATAVWTENFEVWYGEVLVGHCLAEAKVCTVQFVMVDG
ncbi:MAG TPA: hypothetical protein VLL52_22710, partial [Anaerolineae bacterium]|nr:hypothetical protein [Anaerolineae bacterium]